MVTDEAWQAFNLNKIGTWLIEWTKIQAKRELIIGGGSIPSAAKSSKWMAYYLYPSRMFALLWARNSVETVTVWKYYENPLSIISIQRRALLRLFLFTLVFVCITNRPINNEMNGCGTVLQGHLSWRSWQPVSDCEGTWQRCTGKLELSPSPES